MERFAQLSGILAERMSEDVENAVKATSAYVLKCYCSRDPNFNLEMVHEGIATSGPIGEERLKEKCQGPVDYMGPIFQVGTIEEANEEE